MVEGIKQSILLLGDQADFSEQIFTIVRDNAWCGLNLIRIEKRIDFGRILKNNNICLILFCVQDALYFQEALHEVQKYGYAGPLIPITRINNAEITSLAREFGYQEPIPAETVNDCVLLQAIFYSIEKKRIENEINVRDAILRSVNFAAEKFLNNPDWKTYIQDVLQKIGEASRVDRVYLFENVYSEEKEISHVRLIERWIAAGISAEFIPRPGEERTIEEVGIASLFEEIRRTRYVKTHVRELPKKYQPLMQMKNIKSVLLVSIYTNGDWWGFIGFDQCRYEREWKTLEIQELRTAGSLISAAISRQKADARMKYLATHDYLTDLPNRLLFEDHFRGAMARSQRSKKWTGLYVIDLDHFKKVNDTFGHPFGDKVLIEVGKRLQKVTRASDTVARIGGDEFVILGEDLSSSNDVNLVGKKILSAFSEPIVYDHNTVQITPSIGVSIYPVDSGEMEELMHFADVSLYRAKEQGNTFNVYQDGTGKQLWLDNLQKY
ncbi:MAG TPA: sensor domain-containing diguanylate cyclase [Anaerolineaceae bacterium]|mgnify:CR=1 FL=1|nr:sensor domain-containing diguanylate cyclase [Anaerolineaceae bacterium]